MAGRSCHLLLALAVTALIARPATATPAQVAGEHVRVSNEAIVSLVAQASERSNTFRGLVNTINTSDGIVYIEPGRCEHGMKACFVDITMAGPTRILWVMVQTHGKDCDLMGLIGHELQHAVEVLGDPQVTSSRAMYFFYSQHADAGTSPAFETIAAKRTGEAVTAEVRHKSRCTNLR
jgi:hypothetical protein